MEDLAPRQTLPRGEKKVLVPYSVRQREEEARRARVLAQRQAERDAKRFRQKVESYDPTAVAKRRAEQIAEAKKRRESLRARESFGRPESSSPPPPDSPPPPRVRNKSFFDNANDDVVVFRGRAPAKKKPPPKSNFAEEAEETFRSLLRGGDDDTEGGREGGFAPALPSRRRRQPPPQTAEEPLPPPRVLEERRRAALDMELGTRRSRRTTPSQPTQSTHQSTRPQQQQQQQRATPKQPQKPLCVRREREQRRREVETGADKEPETRRCLDKRTARLRYARDFHAAVVAHRATATGTLPAVKLSARVVVRVRPLLPHEVARGEFDAVSADLAPQSVVIHHCTMHADMLRLQHAARTFPCSEALPQTASDDEAYAAAAQPALDVALGGGVAAVFMFGQTGSGKTFTMAAIEQRLADALFSDRRQRLAVRYFEIKGKKAFDLLGGGNVAAAASSSSYAKTSKSRDNKENESEIRLVDEETTCLTVGAQVKLPTCAEEFADVLNAGKRRRSTAATDVNGGSSRSHAVLRLDLSGGGSLMLIDCAGSERSADSMYHDADRRKESAEINQSIYALKCCIRASQKRAVAPPFRSSALTRVLREAFERPDAHLCVVATLSPAATDADHSVTTMTTVAQLAGLSDKALADCSPWPSIVPKAPVAKKAVGHYFGDTNGDLSGGLKRQNLPRSHANPPPAARLPVATNNNHRNFHPRTWTCAKVAAFVRRHDAPAADRLVGLDLDGRNLARMSPAAVAAALTDNDLLRAKALLAALTDKGRLHDGVAARRDKAHAASSSAKLPPPFAFS